MLTLTAEDRPEAQEPATSEEWLKIAQAAFTVALLALGRGETLDKSQPPGKLTKGEWNAIVDAARRKAGEVGASRAATAQEPEPR
jgi:hypothetical protein